MISLVLAFLAQSDPPAVRANAWNFVQVRASDFQVEEVNPAKRRLRVQIEGAPFTELISSWNAQMPGGSSMIVQVQPTGSGKPFDLGIWSNGGQRSVKAQSRPDGRVETDVLILKKPVSGVTVTITLNSANGEFPELSHFYMVLTDPKRPQPVGTFDSAPAVLDVPLRYQMDYPGGSVLCSPTSVSMVLAYWAKERQISALDLDVPQIQKAVYDPVYRGAGNWAFNASFAGSLPGMKGYVSRLRSVKDLEMWIGCGVPVVASVNYGWLKGESKSSGGHLVVVAGFSEKGEPILNDPGRKAVRMHYSRKDFQRAWLASGNTVYLIYPQNWAVPVGGPWAIETE